MSLRERFRRLRKIAVFRRAAWLVAGSLLMSLLSTPAYSQFDIAAVIAGLAAINSTLQSGVGSPLQSLQAMQQQEQQFQQQVIYPLSAIQQAQQLATGSLGQAQQNQSILQAPRFSATMPNPQQLEQALLSADPNQVGQVSHFYTQVYGPLPTTAAASQQTINMIDMNDAAAQDALKKAIQLDALAAREMEVSQSLLLQLQTAPPGSASILTAQASAWVLQGSAYSQSAMAELLRTRSASLAGTGTAYKVGSTSTQNMINVLQNLLHLQWAH
jgi:hypothetical protein